MVKPERYYSPEAELIRHTITQSHNSMDLIILISTTVYQQNHNEIDSDG